MGGIVLGLTELTLSAANLGLSVTIGQLQDQIKDVYNAHKTQLTTLNALEKTLSTMGLGDDKSLKIDIVNGFVTKNFQMLANTSTQQMNNIQQCIQDMDNKFILDLKGLSPDNLGIGLGAVGLGIYMIAFTKQNLPTLWSKTLGKVPPMAQKFYLNIKNALKSTPEIVEKQGGLTIDQKPPTVPTESINDPEEIKNQKWWEKMKVKEKLIKAARFIAIGAMIYGVVEEGKQINKLVNELKSAKDYFSKDGGFQKDLSTVDQDMKSIVAFFSSIPLALKQCVLSMNVMFGVRAFMGSTGRNADLLTNLHLNYHTMGLNDALIAKSLKLMADYTQITKVNSGLQDRINRYGPMLTEFLTDYKAPKTPGNINGMISPTYCFDYVLSQLSNCISTNSINMSDYYIQLQNIIQVGNAVHNYILTRPSNFDQLPQANKQTIDTAIWNQCAQYYAEVILSGSGPLWPSDTQILTGIILNYVDAFYYDDLSGNTINNFVIQAYKAKDMYKDLVIGNKKLGQVMNIPYTPMGKQLSAQQMLQKAIAYSLSGTPTIASKYSALQEAIKYNAYEPQYCTDVKLYMKINSKVTQLVPKDGKSGDAVNVYFENTVSFTIHGIYSFEYSINTLTDEQSFVQIG